MKNPTGSIDAAISALDLNPEHVQLYGNDKAKISLRALGTPSDLSVPQGKLILVSAMTPTPAGEGKTTVSIGLAQGLKKAGHRAALALRQPSMGPVFGRKGTATGGGRSSLVPADAINLHFTGDFHAIAAAHNLLAATIDNSLHFGTSRLDPSRILWKRTMDMNDRALRNIRIGLDSQEDGGRITGFDITAASEIMAILCLSESYADLRSRIDRILIGYTPDLHPVTASEMRVTGAMMAILREALQPNLVQSVEGVPAFVHGGPFANIAHGCNSILASRMALKYADYVVTEAGFAFDLGGEKFMDIKCRQTGLSPDAIVLVVTIRALKMHGGVPLAELQFKNLAAVSKGLENLNAHLAAARFYNRPIIVAINQFGTDTEEEHQVVQEFCASQNIPCSLANVFEEGGEGAIALAKMVAAAAEHKSPTLPFVYSSQDSIENKIEKIVTRIYGGVGVDFAPEAQRRLAEFHELGLGNLPVCMAKTQDSLSDNPKLLGRPQGFRVLVRDFEVANGAGFLVALTGKILRMPALPKIPSAERIQMNDDGMITGW